MLATQHLVTEKYLQQKLKEGLREVHRARRRKAIQNFTTFLMGLVAIPVAVWVGIQIPSWLPVINEYLRSVGILG